MVYNDRNIYEIRVRSFDVFGKKRFKVKQTTYGDLECQKRLKKLTDALYDCGWEPIVDETDVHRYAYLNMKMEFKTVISVVKINH